jgi:hypothetical protein
LLILLLREIQLNVRSTTHRLGKILKPRVPGVRSTTCAFPATFRLAPRSQLLAPLRRISPDLFETWVQGSEWGEQASGTFPIVEISRRQVHGQKQNEHIDEDMALASFHAWMRIESADRGGLLNGFDALRIQDGRTGLRVPPEVFAFSRSQGRQQTKPGAFEAQVAKMVEPSFCKSPVRPNCF